jgi:hypothetical protein
MLEGNVTLRRAVEQPASLRIFLPEKRPYAVTLRADPDRASPEVHQVLTLAMNGTHLQDLILDWNRDRIGQYEFTIPAAMVAPGVQRLDLRSESGFKLWYMRVTPK